MAQALRIFALSAAAIALGCTTTTTTNVPSQSGRGDPALTLQHFMEAVNADDLNTMGELWGTRDGKASDRMAGTELQQRLTVMQIYLSHESFEVLPPDPGQTVGAPQGEAHFRVRLLRKNCKPEVPVTLVPYRTGWLVKSIDLTQAGNPERTC